MIIDTTQNNFCREVERKRQLVNLIADLNRLYPKKKPVVGRTIVCMHGVLTSVTVHVWKKETGLEFDWKRLTGADGEIILQMAEKELDSDCKEFSSQIKFVISNIKNRLSEQKTRELVP